MIKEPLTLEEKVKYWNDCRNPEVPFSMRNKKYLAEVKRLQKAHMSKDEFSGKAKPNNFWDKEWVPFISYDHQWDYAYLLDMLIYKLELMRTNFKYFCSHVDQAKMISQIDEAIILGKKIYNMESADGESYHEPWYRYHKEHSTPYAYVYDKLETESQFEAHKRNKLLAKIEMPKDDAFNFKPILRKKYKSPLDRWLKENKKVEYKDVIVSYGSEWDSFPKIRTLVSKCIMNKCNKRYKQDKEKFFKIISDNLESWWD